MSEVPNDIALDDTPQVGTTSGEFAATKKPKRKLLLQFDLFNTMLLVSFLLITLAFLLMIWHLVDRYGSISSAPWNV